MNGISLKDLRWFTTFTNEFYDSKAVSIWQAVLFILPYFDDDASVNYFEDIQRMELEVYEDLIERLNKKGQPLLRNDASPNYEHSYTEWDDMGNLLLSEEQINEVLPELNRSRLLVIEDIDEADNIYQQLKIEIRNSRQNRPTKIELVEDTLRDDLERVLIKKTSLDAVFSVGMSNEMEEQVVSEVDKPATWEDVAVSIHMREVKSAGTDYTDGESEFYIVFKAKQKILCQGTLKSLKFQGKKKPKPNQLFHLLTSFGESASRQNPPYTAKSYPVTISKLRNLLKEHTGIPNDPFKAKEENRPHTARFKVKVLMD
ncbi:hypothetical protein [Aliiglaciecola litoralis]|uniref:Uncharacterized protein n=1 Tax=Aliiglaciecola litoralis TaxID=582857 RepID=A0ABP3X106_9ALTE